MGRILAAIVCLVTISIARAHEEVVELPPSPYELAIAGQEWHWQTSRGPLHVWIPNGYDPEEAATVIYVHGFYVDVDRAWERHHLREQFAASGINALFVACEAPAGPRDAVSWPSLDALLAEVAAGIEQELPRGPLVAVGHSAAYRTFEKWLAAPRLDTIVLIDAAYGKLAAYKRWMARDHSRRLINVSALTRRRTDRFHRSLPETMVVDGLPESGTLPESARAARVLYVRTTCSHMELVTDGVVLPMLLRALRAPRLFEPTPLQSFRDLYSKRSG